MQNLKPLSDHVVIRPINVEQTTKSGIVLPETVNKEKPEQGEVVAVGPGKFMDNGQRQAIEVKPGDKVLFTKYGPHEIKIDEQELLIARVDDILAIVE